MLFFDFFQILVGKNAVVTVELKNDLKLQGILRSVDTYLNVKLDNVNILNSEENPHFLPMNNCFIRGSVIRYVHLPKDKVDTQSLQDMCRQEAKKEKEKK